MKLSIYHSVVSTFFAPSDLSGVNSMHHECIHALPSWQNGPSHYNTVLVSTNQEIDGMWSLDVGHVCLFFLFTHGDVEYPCALIDRYDCITDYPDEDTGLWIVKPIPDNSAIIISSAAPTSSLCFTRTLLIAHLDWHFSDSLDTFLFYYVDKYAGHHMHKIVFWFSWFTLFDLMSF